MNSKVSINRVFESRTALREWLKNKNYECGSPEAFSDFLNEFFENGNTISVNDEEYDFFGCMEMI